MGYIAKSDGRVSENEIRVATRIMQNMLLTPALKQRAINYYHQGKRADFNLEQVLSSLSRACFQRPNLLHFFLELQLQAAYADGVLSSSKQKILEYICYRLNVDPSIIFQRSQQYENYQRQQNQRQYQNYQSGRNYQPPRQVNLLDQAYKTLGVTVSTNNSDLKKAYRKLMSKNHPDKLVSKGLPEEMIKLATQKTVEIKSAYETICKARGI
jgi:DnaJ like chaperone protein